ncbi:DMT family transporter [Candidatus Dojkabacteria bacterium]|uniref:DMT family transporter n=1 Tax=Candidatus Dojkabacteria bacterium TaxID=2099670 RepID=A0A955RKB1_9BACT|nr:DMT family transporter [Candidatus Dojkabacteria bacterium]
MLKKILPLTLAAAIFSTFGIFARYLSVYFDPFSALIFRFGWVVLILFAILAYRKWIDIKKPPIRDAWIFLLNGLTGAVAGVLVFIAANELTIGTTFFLFYATSTIISYILAPILFKEQLSSIKFAALCIGLLGVVLIFDISLESRQFIHILAGIGAGAGFGIYSITIKLLGNRYSQNQINFSHYSIALLLLLLSVPFVNLDFSITIISTLLTFANGVLFVVVGFLVIEGFKRIEAQKGSLLLLLDPVLGTIWGLLLFQEQPTPQFIAGAVLILLAMALPNIKFHK